MKIAVMPGDGVGNEVIREGLKVLSAASKKFNFSYTTTHYPFGGEYYLKTKETLPDSALKELAAHDAILFGAVGVDPRGSADPARHPGSRDFAEDAIRAGSVHQPPPHAPDAKRPNAPEKRRPG